MERVNFQFDLVFSSRIHWEMNDFDRKTKVIAELQETTKITDFLWIFPSELLTVAINQMAFYQVFWFFRRSLSLSVAEIEPSNVKFTTMHFAFLNGVSLSWDARFISQLVVYILKSGYLLVL